MITVLSHAKSYDWSTWLIGIMRSFVTGGAGAVAGLLGPMATDYDHFNLGVGLHHTLVSMGISFLVVGIVHMMVFLQSHSGPEQVANPAPTP